MQPEYKGKYLILFLFNYLLNFLLNCFIETSALLMCLMHYLYIKADTIIWIIKLSMAILSEHIYTQIYVKTSQRALLSMILLY